ncbi:STAS domain-containing protein [Hymenobacter elongatus]|uniref:STAS domain-containing protein n=1 Tax=Hymenobacter elongatus TaxID=877208 RepID=UPI0021D24D76|nr:STAS domain-containing protein [Hymenobacter elongatus]
MDFCSSVFTLRYMSPLTITSPEDFTPYLIRVNFDEIKPIELARMLLRHSHVRHPRLLIDCQHLRCLRTRGVAYFVSQLLTLRSSGATILLSNVDARLHRTLRLLRLDVLFQVDVPATGSSGCSQSTSGLM